MSQRTRDLASSPAESPPGGGPAEGALRPAPRGPTPVAARRVALAGAHSVDERLRQLEQRLLAEAAGDPHRERELEAHLAHARARFAAATVRQFLPILIEREVRRRLAGH